MNPSEIERTGKRVFFLYRLKEGRLRWLTEDNPPHGARFVARIVAANLGEAIEDATKRNLMT